MSENLIDRRKRILGSYELQVEEILSKAAKVLGAKIYSKIRIADVLTIKYSGLTKTEYRYALAAHFDFVVALNEIGCFAVEYDDDTHIRLRKTIVRDRRKNSVASKLGMPLLRVDWQYLRAVQSQSILDWLLQHWFSKYTVMQGTPVVADKEFRVDKTDHSRTLHERLHDLIEHGYSETAVRMLQSDMAAANSQSEIVGDPFSSSRVQLLNLMVRSDCKVSMTAELDNLGHNVARIRIDLPGPRNVAGQGRCFHSQGYPVDSEGLSKDLAILDTVENLNRSDHYRQSAVQKARASEPMAQVNSPPETIELTALTFATEPLFLA